MVLLAFDVAGHACVLDLAWVREILTVPHVTRVPGAPAALRGLAAVHGQVVPVVDVAVRLGAPPARLHRTSVLLLVEALTGDARAPCALLVDAVHDLLTVPAEAIEARRETGPLADADAVSGFVAFGRRHLLVLDLETLLDRERLHGASSPRATAPARREEAAPARRVAPPEEAPCPRERAPPLAIVGPVTHRPRPVPPPGFAGSRAPDRRAPRASGASPRAALPGAAGASRPIAPVGGPSLARRGEERPAPASAAAASVRVAAPQARSGEPPAAGRGASAARPSRPASSRAWRSLTIAAGLAAIILVSMWLRPGASEARRPRARSAPIPEATPVLATRDAGATPPVASTRPPPPAARGSSTPPPAPAPLPPQGRRVVVVLPGDTLWSLAGRHRNDPRSWPVLYRANGAQVRDPDLILPGQRLVVSDPVEAP